LGLEYQGIRFKNTMPIVDISISQYS